MLYFQDLMPGQAGSATTLYTNTIRVGWIIAGSLAGIAAEIWNYHAVFWFALMMIVATVACLTHQRRLRCGQRLELDEIDHGLVRRLSAHFRTGL